MTRPPALLALLIALATPAQAGRVCPVADPLVPIPGAADVAIDQASVSTAGFPGMWQEGRIGRSQYHYRLFVNGAGSIGDDAGMESWRVDFTCDLEGRQCDYAPVMGPPEAALNLARMIGNCLISEPRRPKARPAPKAETPAQPQENAEPSPKPEPEPAKEESSNPEPTKPEPEKPEPAKPKSPKPATAKPEPESAAVAKPEPAKPNPEKSEPEPETPEPAKPAPSQPETPPATAKPTEGLHAALPAKPAAQGSKAEAPVKAPAKPIEARTKDTPQVPQHPRKDQAPAISPSQHGVKPPVAGTPGSAPDLSAPTEPSPLPLTPARRDAVSNPPQGPRLANPVADPAKAQRAREPKAPASAHPPVPTPVSPKADAAAARPSPSRPGQLIALPPATGPASGPVPNPAQEAPKAPGRTASRSVGLVARPPRTPPVNWDGIGVAARPAVRRPAVQTLPPVASAKSPKLILPPRQNPLPTPARKACSGPVDRPCDRDPRPIAGLPPLEKTPACWVDGLPPGDPVVHLQRLLLLSGQDAGKVDGQLSDRTRAALALALGPALGPRDLGALAKDLRDELCRNRPWHAARRPE